MSSGAMLSASSSIGSLIEQFLELGMYDGCVTRGQSLRVVHHF